ncbi:hypothetical protein F900_01068 [Acinetobacter modestus]|uniref:Antitoxin SocA-like Panacea domain-containing protein n=1 Tax=Acinetobacter modestus TaxID=1776740 RepID=N9NIM9_9GAMM|nr:Panacea domain-containing protein [Acinetobacter modestus]ENX02622.1 hypothetical protein F900_01068 [Acinetobacter modestus]
MLINREREKIINLVAYFADNVNYLGKTKLFKLLYFVDFEHYKLTGRSVTGLDYYAWKMGPVPTMLFDEIERPEPDMQEKVKVQQKTLQNNKKMFCIEAIAQFDSRLFTKRELRLIGEFAQKYKEAKAEDMVEATHLENLPWSKIYNSPTGKQKIIPYELALRTQELEEMKAFISERQDFIGLFK